MPAPTPIAAAPAQAPQAPVPSNGATKGTQPPVKGVTAPQAPAQAGPEGTPDAKYKVKVDGQMVEMTMAEMERYASKGKYADKAIQEGKEAIKRAKAAAAEFEARESARKAKAKDDIDGFLKEHGIDPDEYAKAKLERKVEEGRMTPEQRRAAELEAENKRLKQTHEEVEQQRHEEQRQQLTNQLQKRIETELVGAAKRAGMSLGDESFYAIYESFREAFELGLLPTDSAGLQPHHADRIVEEAQVRLDGAQKHLRENALKLKGPALLEFIGKEAVDAILVARLEQMRAAKGMPARNGGSAPPVAPPAAPKKYLTLAEADAQLKQIGGR